MKRLLLCLSLACMFASCDCGNVACYPGAPDVFVEFIPTETTDSSYLRIENWEFYDGTSKVRLRFEEDTDWDPSLPFMNLISTDSSIQFFGTGIIWENLDDLNAQIELRYGNGESDELIVEIGEKSDDCCTSNSIDGVTFDGVDLEMNSHYFYTTILDK